MRSGVHVSDLTLCIRKGVFRRVYPKPTTMLELNFFTSGRAIHDAIQILAKSHDHGRFEIEKPILHKNIEGHIDLYDSVNNIPIECKTYRSSKIEDPKPHHVDQLKSYLAITNSETGVLLYQLLLNFDDTPFKEFEIRANEYDRKLQLWKLEHNAEIFRNAVDKRDPKLAPSVWDDPTLSWMCKSCPYRQECVKMEFDSDKPVV